MKKKNLIGLISLLLAVALLLVVYVNFSPKGTRDEKTITIEVIGISGDKTTYNVTTNAEFLREAMDDCKDLTYTGIESNYGVMVLEVNNQIADYDKDKSYWAFYVNGEYCQYGIDSQVVNDKDVFSIEYTKD